MWAIFKLNVLTAMVTGQFKNDPDSFAEFYANEYDKAIKSGGDLLYGVNVINGNVKGMADAIKSALKKGTDSVGSNFNILQEFSYLESNELINEQDLGGALKSVFGNFFGNCSRAIYKTISF